jgi:hypothetical protein
MYTENERLTGKQRYRVETIGGFFNRHQVLVLEVEVLRGDGPSDFHGLPTYLGGTIWRDARPQDLSLHQAALPSKPATPAATAAIGTAALLLNAENFSKLIQALTGPGLHGRPNRLLCGTAPKRDDLMTRIPLKAPEVVVDIYRRTGRLVDVFLAVPPSFEPHEVFAKIQVEAYVNARTEPLGPFPSLADIDQKLLLDIQIELLQCHQQLH